jgi:hypothetical protein
MCWACCTGLQLFLRDTENLKVLTFANAITVTLRNGHTRYASVFENDTCYNHTYFAILNRPATGR